MATTPEIIETLAPKAGLKLSTVERLTRPLRVELLSGTVMAPTGKRGGGIGAAHWNAWHLKNLTLGFSGILPSDGAEAVRLLDPLRTPGDDLTLGEYLVQLIEAPETDKLAGTMAALGHMTWELTLCLDPVMAWMSWIDAEHKEQRIVYSPGLPLFPHDERKVQGGAGVRKLTSITLSVIMTLRKLYQDSLAQVQILASNSFEATKASKAPPLPAPVNQSASRRTQARNKPDATSQHQEVATTETRTGRIPPKRKG